MGNQSVDTEPDGSVFAGLFYAFVIEATLAACAYGVWRVWEWLAR